MGIKLLNHLGPTCETGTWIPTVYGETIAGIGTYGGGLAGQYTKIGDLVFVSAFIGLTAHTGSGNMRIGGLPFVARGGYQWASLCHSYLYGLTVTSGASVTWAVENSTNTVRVYQCINGSSSRVTLDATFEVMLAGCYHI